MAQAVDWSSWLSRAGLDPAAVREYALLFARNQLDARDVKHFDHEFLLSMGVAVAKHRLQILKLARAPAPAPKKLISSAIDASRRSLARCVRSLVKRGAGASSNCSISSSTALVLAAPAPPAIPPPCIKRGRAIPKSTGKMEMLKKLKGGPMAMMGCGGGGKVVDRAATGKRRRPISSTRVQEYYECEEEEEMMRWDSLFTDLRPT